MNNLNIYIESNPNPNSLKFVTNIMLVDEGIVKDYPDIQSAEDSPLAKKLFHFNYVKRVFIMSNFITITKSEKFSWEEIKLDLRDFIKKYIEEEKEIISKAKKQSSVKSESESESNNIDEKIKNILEEYIKPAVEQDGGAIDFESFDNGRVTVSLKGACSGCPSSTLTLKSGIENLLKRFIPEVKEVVAEEN
tara:strand:+ start:75 stop:650 length:576 start_codon:yes stop_codon:yes gene_type:complete